MSVPELARIAPCTRYLALHDPLKLRVFVMTSELLNDVRNHAEQLMDVDVTAVMSQKRALHTRSVSMEWGNIRET